MFGPVETKLDELTTKRFISCLWGSGKTTQMLWSINKILEKGETCLVVTPCTFIFKDLFPDRKLPEGVKLLHIDKLLKYLKRYNPEQHKENDVTDKDYYFIPRRFVELFNCDRIVIDPECYIKIIQQYVEKFQKIDKIVQELQKLY